MLRKIIESTIEEATKRAFERGLPICEVAVQVMKDETCYMLVRNSIWQNIHDASEFIICLRASDYMEGRQHSPQSWGWKVPGILLLHLGSKASNHEYGNISYGKVTDTDFYLFKLRFTHNPL